MKRLAFLIGFSLLMLPALLMAHTAQPLFSIPFKLIDNRPFIAVEINGRFYHFILDTGAGNALDKAVADSLHLNLDNATILNSADGKQVTFWMTQVDSIHLGGQTLRNNTLQVTDFSEIKQKLKLPYLDGIIGYNFMRNYAVQFDYAHNLVNFYKSYSGLGGMAFSLHRGQTPRIRVQVDGTPIMVTLVTGDRNALTVFAHQSEKLGLSARYPLSPEKVIDYGLGGPVNARAFVLKQLKIGDRLWKAISANVPNVAKGGFALTDLDGTLGGAILKAYKLTIDYPERKVYFE